MDSGTLRREQRIQFAGRVEVTWTAPDGSPRLTTGNCADISAQGMRMETGDAIPVRSYVQFAVKNSPLRGTASVRSCDRKGMHFRIGMEFTGGLRWNVPASNN